MLSRFAPLALFVLFETLYITTFASAMLYFMGLLDFINFWMLLTLAFLVSPLRFSGFFSYRFFYNISRQRVVYYVALSWISLILFAFFLGRGEERIALFPNALAYLGLAIIHVMEARFMAGILYGKGA